MPWLNHLHEDLHSGGCHFSIALGCRGWGSHILRILCLSMAAPWLGGVLLTVQASRSGL